MRKSLMKSYLRDLKHISVLRWRHSQILPYFVKRCLPIWIHWWLGKIQWNITCKRNILWKPNNGKYHRLWLQTYWKNLKRLWIAEPRSIPWYVCTEWYPSASRCIWKLQKQVYWDYELDPGHSLSASRFGIASMFK